MFVNLKLSAGRGDYPMIVFSGWRTLAVLALGGALLALLGDSMVASVFIGAFIAAAGFWINSPKMSADGVMYHERNSLMFIPLQWWGVAVIATTLLGAIF